MRSALFIVALMGLTALSSGCHVVGWPSGRAYYGTDVLAKLESKETEGEKLRNHIEPPPPMPASEPVRVHTLAAVAPTPAPTAIAAAPAPVVEEVTGQEMATQAEVTEASHHDHAEAHEEPRVAEAPKPRRKRAEPASVASSDRTHTVAKGETLQKISMRYYGTTRRWPKIFEANKSALASPDKIKVGMKIQIP
ncbi:MAG: LysM peptidoglycan-binding domain-containing protein [Planctomycetota bacterium]|jgi:nucleoid-associated protein YgaU